MGDDGPAPTRGERQRLDALELGHDRGDSLVDAQLLARPDNAHDPQATPGEISKGFYHPISALPDFDDICLMPVPWWASPSGESLPSAWQDALEWAANRWNSKTYVHIRWAEFWDTSCDEWIFAYLDGFDGGPAMGLPPEDNGDPGPELIINASYEGETCENPGSSTIGGILDIPRAEKRRTALHEIGHTLGMRHPGANFPFNAESPLAVQIPTTEGPDGLDFWHYPTVMHTGGCIGDLDGNIVGNLSADDIKSLNVVVYLSNL